MLNKVVESAEVRKSGTELLDLPVELLNEILKLLSWNDVLRMRKTCRFLSEATRTRAIWAHLVNEHISSTVVPPRLECPIEIYASSELEHLFLRWKCAENAWQTKGGYRARMRTFPCERGESGHLVNGGRWYLVTARNTAAVKCYDLDAETISGVDLIPPQADCTWYNAQGLKIALDIDRESRYLEFTMAFSIFDQGSNPVLLPDGTYYEKKAIHIWRITCRLDNSGHVIGLSATKVATIPHRPTIAGVFSISVRGPLLAMAAYDGEAYKTFVMVMEWQRHAHEGESYPLRIIDCVNARHVSLLPHNRLFAQYDGGLFCLYDYSTVQETATISRNGLDRKSVLVWDCAHRNIDPGDPFTVSCIGNTARVLVDLGSSILTLTFEADSRERPSFVQALYVTPQFPPRKFFFGFSRCLIVAYNRLTPDVFQLVTHRFSDGDESVVSSSSITECPVLTGLPSFITHPPMDEDTGRIILPGNEDSAIVDFF